GGDAAPRPRRRGPRGGAGRPRADRRPRAPAPHRPPAAAGRAPPPSPGGAVGGAGRPRADGRPRPRAHHRLRAAAGRARRASPGGDRRGAELPRMKTRMVRRAVLVVALLAGAAPAWAQSELRVAIPWTPENLDPTMNLSSLRSQVGVSLFDSLVGRDADGKIVGELAESWRALDDRTWQLKLRRGVSFHNGEPFNAEAVRFTFQRVLNPEQKSPNRATVSEV